MQTRIIRGIAASPGTAVGPVFRYEARRSVAAQATVEDVQSELAHLDAALEQARRDVHMLFTQAQQQIGSGEAAIFEAHEMFLNDPDLLQQVRAAIQEQHQSAAYAWQEATKHYIEQLRALGNEYLAARAQDVEDVAQRVLHILLGTQGPAAELGEPAVIVATNLTPSETVQLESAKVRAFCTAEGSATSHVAILAKALGIPAVTGLGASLDLLKNGNQVIVDGSTGEVLIEPDPATLARYSTQAQSQAEAQQAAFALAQQPAITPDGTRVEVVANIGKPEQVAEALRNGAEGVGLLRTEFLFLEREQAPDEEEQTAIYCSVLEAMGQRPVVVRTFDIGGDKPLPYIRMQDELNPFLGVRGIRLALTQPELLQLQLRALLRAGVGYNLKIMFPMVTSSEEIEALHEQVTKAREMLAARGNVCADRVEVGIMVEVPAAALMADVLAKQVDFFSIGTNDLAQYTLAADRTNATVATLADALHPAVLRLIRDVIEAAHVHGKWVGLCGELAGDPLAVPVLLGLGLDEFSMTPRAVPVVKQQIRRYRLAEAREIALRVLDLRNAVEVRTYLKSVAR